MASRNPSRLPQQELFQHDIIPELDSTYDLGSSSKAWAEAYIDTIKTVSGTKLTLLPTGASITQIGDAGSTSHTLNTNDDLFVAGSIEVDLNSYFDGGLEIQKTSSFEAFVVRVGSEGYMYINSYTDDGIHISLNSIDNKANNNLILTAKDNKRKNHDHNPVSTNPTFFIHSNTDPDTNNTQWISFTHDQTDGVIDCGLGTLNLGGTANVNFAGATATASTVTHDAYVELEVAGVIKKFMLGA